MHTRRPVMPCWPVQGVSRITSGFTETPSRKKRLLKMDEGKEKYHSPLQGQNLEGNIYSLLFSPPKEDTGIQYKQQK